MPVVKLSELLPLVSPISVEGDENREVSSLCTLDLPAANGITFAQRKLSAEQITALSKGNVAAVLVKGKIRLPALERTFTVVRVLDPLAAVVKIVPLFFPAVQIPPGIDRLASVHPTAVIPADAVISAFTYLGENVIVGGKTIIHPHVTIYRDCKIGKNCIIHAGAVLREGSVLGDNVIIQPGAVIGADGFGYLPTAEGLALIPQVGTVHLSSRVEIGANSCIDRATFGVTKVGYGTKIDNQVQVGHNCAIGAHTVICGHVGIAGSCNIGDQVVIGGNTGVRDHINIVDQVRVGGQSGVWRDLTEKGDYMGMPAIDAKEWQREALALTKRMTKKAETGDCAPESEVQLEHGDNDA